MKQCIGLMAFSVFVLSGCGQNPNFHPHALSSGKQIKVLSVGTIHFSQDSPALMLRYQTDLDISDGPTLRREVDEIWKDFQSEVEKAGLKNAIISANDVPKGFILTQGKSYNFIFEKEADGKWKCSN